MPYQHFALEEGYCLAGFWEKGQGIRVAARMPQRPPPAASRGLGRNRGKRGYHPYGAYSKAKHQGRMPHRLLQGVWGGEAGICGDGLKCGALEPGAGCGAMGEGTSRHRTGLSGTLPAHQAGLLPRGVSARGHLRRRGRRRVERRAGYNTIHLGRIIPGRRRRQAPARGLAAVNARSHPIQDVTKHPCPLLVGHGYVNPAPKAPAGGAAALEDCLHEDVFERIDV